MQVGTVVKVIILVLLIAMLCGAFYAIFKLSNGFKSDIKTFYVTIDGDIITENTSKVDLLGKTVRVHFLEDPANKSFGYKIVKGSGAADFAFETADNKQHNFLDVDDYTKAFDVSADNGSIQIRAESLNDILSRQYGGAIVFDHNSATLSGYFELVITSSDTKHELRLGFSVAPAADGVSITPSGIVF